MKGSARGPRPFRAPAKQSLPRSRRSSCRPRDLHRSSAFSGLVSPCRTHTAPSRLCVARAVPPPPCRARPWLLRRPSRLWGPRIPRRGLPCIPPCASARGVLCVDGRPSSDGSKNVAQSGLLETLQQVFLPGCPVAPLGDPPTPSVPFTREGVVGPVSAWFDQRQLSQLQLFSGGVRAVTQCLELADRARIGGLLSPDFVPVRVQTPLDALHETQVHCGVMGGRAARTAACLRSTVRRSAGGAVCWWPTRRGPPASPRTPLPWKLAPAASK